MVVSLVRTVSTGSTRPLTVRVVGALESMFSVTMAPSFTCRSFRATMCSGTSCRGAGRRAASPSTTNIPARPANTCASVRPCRCEWYQ